MNTSYRIGVDIGGTKVNAGILRPDGSILKKCLLSSGGAGNPRAFVDEICSSLRAMLDELNIPLSLVEHIGVGIPGTADSARGVVEYSCNLFGRNVPLGDYFDHALAVGSLWFRTAGPAHSPSIFSEPAAAMTT